jgi:hypothetical protein
MTRSSLRLRRGALAAALTIGLVAGTGAALATPAAAASNGFIAVSNGMVGVTETITINAPKAKGQAVTVTLQVGATTQTLQTTIGSNGYGYASWTPAAAGTWIVTGQGALATIGTSTLTVAPMPTYTVLLAQNNLELNVQNNILVGVVAPIGVLAPTGTASLKSTATTNVLASAPLTSTVGSTTATANVPWTPTTGGTFAMEAAYTPASGGQLASSSPSSLPQITGATAVSLRWPATLYAGAPTTLQAVLGTGMPEGSVAFSLDGNGISGSIATVNGVGTLQWTPPSTGIHTIAVAYTGVVPNSSPIRFTSGVSSQIVNIQPARATDNLTVSAAGQGTWGVGQSVSMRAGTSVVLSGASQSGTPVLLSEQGPCVISGATLTVLSAGQCQITAVSPGNAQLAPGSETYSVTITAAPKRK